MERKNRTPEIVAQEWLNAKQLEKKSNALRVELESELIEMLGMKPEGSKTHSLDGLKVVITGKLNRKLDRDAYLAIQGAIPADLDPVRVVTKLEVEDAGCRWLAENRADLWAVMAKAITTTPAKPAVAITREG